MKLAINQAAAVTAPGTQDWTDATNAAGFVAEIFISGAATANDTVANAGKIHVGIYDGTRDAAAGFAIQNNTSAPNCKMRSVAGSIVNLASAGTATWLAAVSAAVSNGIRENYSAAAASPPLISGLNFADTDIDVKVATGAFAATDLSATFAHNNSGAPTAFWLVVNIGETAINGGAACNQIQAFYETGGGTAASLAFRQTDFGSPTAVSALINNDFGHQIDATTDIATFTLDNIDATNVRLNRSAHGSTALTYMLISFRAKNGATLFAKAGVFTNPTATGAFTPATGLGCKPQLLVTLGSRLTTAGAIQTDDTAGSVSVGLMCDNAGTTQYATIASSSQDNVSTSVAKSQCSNNKMMQVLASDGTLQFAATGTAFNFTGGVGSIDANCSQNTGAIAAKTAYLMIGVQSAGSATATPSCGSLTIGGLVATELREKIITPAAASLSMQGLMPSNIYPGQLAPIAGALSITGLAPTVVQVGGPITRPDTAGLAIVGQIPFLLREKIITPDLPSFAGDETGLAPTILTEWTSIPTAPAQLTINGLNPLVIAGGLLTVTPGAGLVQMQSLAATIVRAVGQDGFALPDRGELDVIGLAPTIYGVVPLAADVGALSITGLAPSIFTRRAWHPSPNPGSRTWHAP